MVKTGILLMWIMCCMSASAQTSMSGCACALSSITKTCASHFPEHKIPGINITQQDVCNRPTLKCNKSCYRSIDGTCNNLKHPYWGATNSTYVRFIKSNYEDGVSELPRLPNPRYLRLEFFEDVDVYDYRYTLLTMQWGQLLSHDFSLTAGVPQNNYRPPLCCKHGELISGYKNNPRCAPITIPKIDPIHKTGSCWDFIRTTNTKQLGCTGANEPAEQVSVTTAYLDCSIVYGSTPAQAKPLRTYTKGQLKTVTRQGQHWLPQEPYANITCATLSTEPCYVAGDIRVNQNPDLALLQVMLAREHNKIASQLATLNPGWNDEKLYQEARSIVIAEFQHITYYENLPVLLGYEYMVKRGLIYPNAKGYVNDYDPEVNAGVLNEFATAAFRHFHSMVVGILYTASERRKYISDFRLSDWYFKSDLIEKKNNFNNLLSGLTYYPMSYNDVRYDYEITEYLFKGNHEFGTDLRSIDLQRSRDHGLPSYVVTRGACGLSVPKTFEDMLDYIPIEYVKKLKKIYKYPENVDMVVGASLETNLPGAQVGPTYHCIVLEQFWRSRVGDRFFYESSANGKCSLTIGQLRVIRKGASAARILCDNSNVTHMQPNAFLQVSNSNPLLHCEDLPSIDLSLWKE